MPHVPRALTYSYYRSQNWHGWSKLINPLIDLCEARHIEIFQIKEKFGGLRFYVGSIADKDLQEVEMAINKAEDLSYKTCETCGEPGELRKGGWLKCRCDACHQKSQIESK
jgi:hypothetical protein